MRQENRVAGHSSLGKRPILREADPAGQANAPAAPLPLPPRQRQPHRRRGDPVRPPLRLQAEAAAREGAG